MYRIAGLAVLNGRLFSTVIDEALTCRFLSAEDILEVSELVLHHSDPDVTVFTQPVAQALGRSYLGVPEIDG